MVDSPPSSPPMNFSLAGNFSADDIQELLGAMSGDQLRSMPLAAETSDAPIGLSASVNAPPAAAVEEARDQSRSERKRTREKQRRSDVNKQFADLTSLLRRIESEEGEGSRLTFSPTNRVELISRTISHLERLREENKRRKLEVESLQQQLDQAKQAGEETAAKLKEVMFNQPPGPPQNKQVMMMVPMMMSADGSSHFAHGQSATTPHSGMQMMQPFVMPPQPHGAPHAPQGFVPVPMQPNASSTQQQVPVGFPPATAPQPMAQPTTFAPQLATEESQSTSDNASQAPAPTPLLYHAQHPIAIAPAPQAGIDSISNAQDNAMDNNSTDGGSSTATDKTPRTQSGSNLAHCA